MTIGKYVKIKEMYGNYYHRGNSSIETLAPLLESPQKFNLSADNSKSRLPQLNSISNNDKSPVARSIELSGDGKYFSKIKSNNSFSSTDNFEFSQLWKLYENNAASDKNEFLLFEMIDDFSETINETRELNSDLPFPISNDTLKDENKKKMHHRSMLIHNATQQSSNEREILLVKRPLGDSEDLKGELQYLSAQNSSVALTTSDYISPIPVLAYSPSDKIGDAQKFKLQKVLQELLDSEENYIVSLTLLLNYYIDPLVNDESNKCGLPLVIMKRLLLTLIEDHTKMLQYFRLSLLPPQDIICENPIIESSVAFAKKIFEVGLNVPIYGEYCNIYEDVLKLVKESNNVNTNQKKEFNLAWVKGWKNYLEATQPVSKRLDLSFLSLVQKPISRVAKYGLIVESLLKYSYSNSGIYLYYNLIKLNLQELNENSRLFKENDPGLKINNFLNFEGLCLGVELSLEFFGKCLMIGSWKVAWIEIENVKSSTFGVFLYKSYLVLSDISTRKIKKHEIRFIIPLSICNLFKNPKDCGGGLYSKHSYTQKLIFEHRYSQYEILIMSITKSEHEVWLDYLDTLINHVNGPYALGNTDISEDYQCLILYPENMVPYDISLLKISNYKNVKDYCYFQTPIFVNVIIEFPTFNETLENGYVLIEEDKNFIYPQTSSQTITITINKIERVNAEINLAAIWSKELPLIFPTLTKQTIKKSSSWSQIKMGMGSFRGLRTSQSFSEGINSIRNHQQPENNSDQEGFKLERYGSMKQSSSDPFENDKMAAECANSEMKRINSKSYKFRNAVLGLFQIPRSNSIKMATD